MWLVLAALAWGVLAFGAVYPWAYVTLLIVCAATGLGGLLRAFAPWWRRGPSKLGPYQRFVPSWPPALAAGVAVVALTSP